MTKGKLTISLVAAVTLIASIAVASTQNRDSGGDAGAVVTSAHPAPTGPEQRTVDVYRGEEPTASEPGPLLRAQGVKGSIPARPVRAMVLTDEDCAPDAQGVSHCINRVRLSSGKMLVLKHPHNMTDVPCLAPRERVTVRPA